MNPPEQVAAVSAILSELGLPATLLSQLLGHALAVEQDADRLGLISSRDIGAVLSRHTADSLLFAIAREPLEGEHWVDVGSGAGFPGLVLACCYPATHFTLVEPQARRAGFLDLQCSRYGLANVALAVTRAADLEPRFDVATARALAEPAIALETLHRLAPLGTVLLAVGGSAVAPSGVEDLDVSRPGVDSPGRIFKMSQVVGGA